MKVLVTGAGALLGQGIIKSLRMAERGYHIVAADPDPRAVGLYWADSAYLIPVASAPDYLDAVRQILDHERPNAVLIGTDVELLTFAEQRAVLETEYATHIIVSSPDVINIADDKWLTYQFLRNNHFPHPHSTLPDGLSDFMQDCDFPFVVKPRVGARSTGVSVVRNAQELEMALALVPNPIIQECVATAEDEYTSGVIVVNHGVRAVVTMRRDLRDGNTYRAYVQPDAPFNSLLAEIAQALTGFGPLNFQFRVADSVPKVFEINARFSGTTPLRAYAGFNEVDLFLQLVVNDAPISPPDLRPVVVLRYWDEIVLSLDELRKIETDRHLAGARFERPFKI